MKDLRKYVKFAVVLPFLLPVLMVGAVAYLLDQVTEGICEKVFGWVTR
ncbi:hypothetical protein C7416_104463 [Cupriavidus phytorum]|uniref:Uncharacterized protein n=2 Tax=Cupriavidus phytorum TaxID=3024399 RepID=A0A2W7P079_9BURK|nr:hypothetical protein C7416_104463 [Cupriavidus alkaliphilus]